MRYMLLLYDNADTRDAFFGSEPLGAEVDAILRELQESGELVATDPLADPVQTKMVRVRADRPVVTDGPLLIGGALSAGMVGCFQLQAAIAAVHAEAPSTAETDWRQITALYELLERIAPNPVFTLNRAVALAMFRGPEAALELLGQVERDTRLAEHHRVASVRGHLLELAGDAAGAADSYEIAARLTTSLPERQYLQRRAVAARASG